MYKPVPEIFIAEWLSRHNHVEGKDRMIQQNDHLNICGLNTPRSNLLGFF